MAKLYVISQGAPWMESEKSLAFRGHIKIGDDLGEWSLYQISGTPTQLANINALPEVVGLVIVTESQTVFRPELDNTISATRRTKINNWLTARGLPTIPANTTYKQVINAILSKITKHGLEDFNCAE